jgi:CheY-like chemotaxis protein
MALTLVLSVGLDPEILGTRNIVLQSAGYTVVRAFSLKAAVDCFQALDFDLILLCQSIPTKEKDRLTSWIRASGSRVPVVSVAENLCQQDAFADATVESDPKVLLMGIRQALVKAGIPAGWTAAFSHKKDAVVSSPRGFAAAQGKSRFDQAPAMSNG